MNMWIIFAILSAVFAALTSILAKVGIEGVDSNLATAVRTVVVVIMAWAMVFITNAQSGLSQISRKSWIFLILSGIATGDSWLCYYKAIQLGDVSKVVPVDKLSVVPVSGILLGVLGDSTEVSLRVLSRQVRDTGLKKQERILGVDRQRKESCHCKAINLFHNRLLL